MQVIFHHLISQHWITEGGKLPCFAQVYIYDIDAQVNYRIDLNDAFSVPFVQMLTRLLNQHNHHAVNSIPKLEQLQI